MIEFCFWASVFALVYTYLGYPVVIWGWAKLRPRPPSRAPVEPSVCVIVAAHNEVSWIDRRLRNLVNLDYPRDRLQIVLASDGSTDGTAERARTFRSEGVDVLEFPRRRGKPSVLNDAVERATAQVIVFADARQVFEPGVLRALVRSFADPAVGAVSGELMLGGERVSGTAVEQGTGAYWRYEKFLRIHESLIDSTVGVTGAIYAIRREVFEAFPAGILLDDVWLPMRITRRGLRVVFEREAQGWDRPSTTEREEFQRKVRTIGGNFQLFAHDPWLLNPFVNRIWFQVVSHKICRLASPLLLVSAAAASLLLSDQTTYRWLFAGQCAFYGAAACGSAVRKRGGKALVLSVPYVFCLLNWATVVAFARTVMGRQPVTWAAAHSAEPVLQSENASDTRKP